MRLYQFSDMVGNSSVLSMLGNSLMNGTLPNLCLMVGEMGTGKSTASEVAALRITCTGAEKTSPNPCLKCDSCTMNLNALASTGTSTNLVKVNAAMLVESNKDLTEVMKSIFYLKGSIGKKAYILEDFQALKEDQQVKFLDEIDRLNKNTYLFIPTNRPDKVIRDLISRGVSFNFAKLNDSEAKFLFDRIIKKLDVKKPGTAIERMIIRHARGTPRNLVNLTKFVLENAKSEEEIRNFLAVIKNEVFVSLFYDAKAGMLEVANAMERITKIYSSEIIYVSMKEFLYNVIFCLGQDTREDFSKDEIEMLRGIFTKESLSKTMSIIDGLGSMRNISDTDLKYAMLRVRQALIGKTPQHIIAENKREASRQSITANETFNEEKDFRESIVKASVKEVTLNTLNKFVVDS